MRSSIARLSCLLPGMIIFAAILLGGCVSEENPKLRMAVEFMDHAAPAYLALDKGWFAEADLTLSSWESYATGMALSSALARGDVQIAYICLVPALNAYANAGVDLKIVAGTHRYGYGLVVDPGKITAVRDLEKPNLRIGCVRQGGTVDVLMQRVMTDFDLEPASIEDKVQRMNPQKQLLAIRMGRLDAAFLPEQWATLAEDEGFEMLLTARDVWPSMPGSVLVVTGALLEHPDLVRKLVRVNQRATDWLNRRPGEAAAILAEQFSLTKENPLPGQTPSQLEQFEISPHTMSRSMQRIEYTTALSPDSVQEVIDTLTDLHYIKDGFEAEDILE